MNEGTQDHMDAPASDQLDQPASDELVTHGTPATPENLEDDQAGDGETTGDQETAPAFPDQQSEDPDAPGYYIEPQLEATQPNPYSPGYGITEKFPAVQDDEAPASEDQ